MQRMGQQAGQDVDPVQQLLHIIDHQKQLARLERRIIEQAHPQNRVGLECAIQMRYCNSASMASAVSVSGLVIGAWSITSITKSLPVVPSSSSVSR